jgi:hypothetical protein
MSESRLLLRVSRYLTGIFGYCCCSCFACVEQHITCRDSYEYLVVCAGPEGSLLYVTLCHGVIVTTMIGLCSCEEMLMCTDLRIESGFLLLVADE